VGSKERGAVEIEWSAGPKIWGARLKCSPEQLVEHLGLDAERVAVAAMKEGTTLDLYLGISTALNARIALILVDLAPRWPDHEFTFLCYPPGHSANPSGPDVWSWKVQVRAPGDASGPPRAQLIGSGDNSSQPLDRIHDCINKYMVPGH
jgi:hypothetical protein